MWQKTDAVAGHFNSSVQYCQDLALGGYTDWRMPEVQEVITLFDYPGGIPAVFDRTTPNQWTRDQKWDGSYTANVKAMIIRTQINEDHHSVRCVRGTYGILSAGYLTGSDGCVADTRNQLTWTRADDGAARDYDSARSYCENLDYADRTDWRLPTATEIASIADYTAYDEWGPMVNTAFAIPRGRQHYNYWTGSEGYAEGYGVRLSFRDGSVVIQSLISSSYALCVSPNESAPPTAAVSGAPANLTNNPSATLTVGGAGVVAYRYKVDGGGFSAEIPVGTPINLLELAEGPHGVAVIGKNLQNNWQPEASATTASWTTDYSAPTATVSGAPESPVNQRAARLTVAGAEVLSYRYELNGGGYSSETDVGTPIDLSGLAEGTHTVAVIGKDAAGNWQETDGATTVSWTVDMTPPSGGISLNGGAAYCTEGRVAIALEAGGAQWVRFSNDGVTWSAWEALGSSKAWTLAEGDGAKEVYVQFGDSAGNTHTASAGIILDTIPPEVPVPVRNPESSENMPTLDWEVAAGSSGYILEYADSVDFNGAVRIEDIRPSDYTPESALADGTWYWRVRAVDAAGNASDWCAPETLRILTAGYCAEDPDQPVLLSPADSATGVSRTPVLTVADFAEPRPCSSHWKTRWQISERPDFNGLTLNANSFENLLTHAVTKSLLEPNTTYFWRVRFWGTNGNKSEWSDVSSFTTESANEDLDEDGVADVEEVGAGVDLDGDGVEDEDQGEEMKSVKAAKGALAVGIRPLDARITRADAVDDAELEESDLKPKHIPNGMFAYRLELSGYGRTATIRVHLSEPAPANAYWVIFDPADGWQDFSEHAEFDETRTTVTIRIKDGGVGDCDHTENATIVDPGGIALREAAAESPVGSTGGGGCFVSTAEPADASSALPAWGLFPTLALLAAAIGWKKESRIATGSWRLSE
jgi:hypothetical protein